MPGTRALDRALRGLSALRDSLRAAGNRERAGLFSCAGCVAWCCREGFNSMRATPLEAEALVRHVEERGLLAETRERCEDAADRWRLDADPASRRTYTCPFLTPGNLCAVHPVKPLGCIAFTPVRDGGCDADARRLADALGRAADLGRRVPGRAAADLPIPLAFLAAAGRRSSASSPAR